MLRLWLSVHLSSLVHDLNSDGWTQRFRVHSSYIIGYVFFVGFERKILSELFLRVNLPGMQNSAAALEKSLAIPQMIKHRVTL